MVSRNLICLTLDCTVNLYQSQSGELDTSYFICLYSVRSAQCFFSHGNMIFNWKKRNQIKTSRLQNCRALPYYLSSGKTFLHFMLILFLRHLLIDDRNLDQ